MTRSILLDDIKNAIKTKNAKIFILIDEYDRFANELMFTNPEAYDKLLAGTTGDKLSSPVRSFFTAIKAISEVRSFTTGLSPIALADASGANNISYITQDPRFANMLGFTEATVECALKMLFDKPEDVTKALSVAKEWFNGYRFPYHRRYTAGEPLYTPQLCLSFFRKCCDPNFRNDVLTGGVNQADMSDPGVKVPSNIVPLLSRHPELPLIFASLRTPDGVQNAAVQETFKLSELHSAPGPDLPVSFMVWHGLLTRAEHGGFTIPNRIMGDATQLQGLISEIYRGTQRTNVDALAVVRCPTEEGLWNLLTASLSCVQSTFDNTVSELAIQGLVEQFIRTSCGSVSVEAENSLPSSKRSDLLLTARTSVGEELLIEIKRLRPGAKNNEADISLKRIIVSSSSEARSQLAGALITDTKQQFFGGAKTVGELERKAMTQCQAYKSEMMKKNATKTIRCATAIHVTVSTGSFPNIKFESAFLVAVEP